MVGMARGGVADGTRHGQGGTCGDVAFVAEELKAVLDPRSGQWMKGRYVPSLLAAIGFMSAPDNPGAREGVLIEQDNDRPRIEHVPAVCPKCALFALIRQEGCDLCTSCRHSKCG